MKEDKLKILLLVVLSLFLVALSVLAGAAFFYLNSLGFGIVSVSGQGKVVYQPDLARISVAVITKGKEPKQVQQENDRKVRQVIDFLKQQGVKEEDIQTSSYNLYPEYEPVEISGVDRVNPLKIIGYSLTQGLSFKVREISSTGEILAGLTAEGINNIENISFGLSDEKAEELRLKAKQLAVAKAQAEFEKLRLQLGVRKFFLAGFSDSTNYPSYLDERVSFKMGDSGALVPSPIQAGSAEIVVNVNLSYKVR